MELENVYQDNLRMGDFKRNKFAISSFVIALISIILSPLIIPQILGIVFAALGMKSEKKGFSIAGLIINIITLLFGIILILAVVSFNMFGSVLTNSQIRADEQTAVLIQNAIVNYIQDTGDVELKFGENEAPTVQNVILRLQDKATMNETGNGAYLTPNSNGENVIKLNSSKYKGWEININKSEGMVEVKPSETGDSLSIK